MDNHNNSDINNSINSNIDDTLDNNSAIYQISTTDLRYLVSLARERHFAKAARTCFVSQPTLSIAIKKLENNLGVTIFERNKTGVLITTMGEEIINKATSILKLMSEIEDIAITTRNPLSIPLRVGAIHTVGPYLFPGLIAKLRQEHSELKLFIEEGFTKALHNKLVNGELDAIIVADPFEYSGINTLALYQEPLDIIVPINHPWVGRSTLINPSELAQETLLLLGQGNCFRDQVLQICPQCIDNDNSKVMPNKSHTANMIITSSLETIKHMVVSDIGISIMPRTALNDIVQNKAIAIKHFTLPMPKRKIVIAYRVEFPRSRLVIMLANIIKEVIKF